MAEVSSVSQTPTPLVAALKERELSQRDLVSKLRDRGFAAHESHISRVCNGLRPGASLRDAIAVILDLEEHDLWK